MSELPTGTATFLFTDIEGSTKLVHELGEDYDALLDVHRELLRTAFVANNGVEIGTEGDSFFVVFARATDALRAAVEAQRALTSHEWPRGQEIRVRMGMHTGEARVVADDYVGLAVHQAARVSSAAHGGQILISEATRALVHADLPDSVRLLDLGRHHLKDLPHAEPMFQVEHPHLESEFPPIRSLDVRRHNLPTQLTSFVGRESELVEIRKLVDSSRLVTLTGAGGCGKTRLALETAADVMAHFADGVRLVDLAPVSDHDVVPQAIANALGLREQEGRTIESMLEDYFAIKEMLLIIDNCEHLVQPAADIVERLLKLTADLKILVTTREPLGVEGEMTWRVPSLEAPDPRRVNDLDTLRGCQSTRLFIDRAASADAEFSPAPEDLRAIAEVCHRLDGIPLAIELAAARMDVLTPAQIAERLNDRFRLLTGGRRSALARQQTLQALVDWSYDLLDADERKLLERISVFAGSFSLEAAEQVCADEDIPPTNILDVLSQLVRKSLLTVHKHGAQARYRTLETIKQYGRDKLFASPDATTIRTKHRDYYLDRAER
ncbi:MAG: adenylate/guanylate cyclase domain-containing protein, partial [Actinomycetota bacterium]